MLPANHKCLFLLAAVGILLLRGASAPAGPADRQYQAQWIWGHVESSQPFQFVRFCKTVELPSRPVRVTAYITADTFYRLWINGQLAMHGPARSSRGKATVDPVDVNRHLTQGKNTLMIEAFHGDCRFEALAQAPGLLCELEADFGGRKAILAATDATWVSAEITAWSRDSLRFNFQRGWIEQFDARRTLGEKLRPAIVLGKVGMAPWRKVEIRDIPLPAPLAEVRPASVVATQRGDGFVGSFHGPETRIEPRAEWDQRSAWFRRLHTEHLAADSSAATNPQGLTEKGTGDAVLHGNGAGVAGDFGRGYVGFVGFEVTGKAGQVIEIAWNDQLSGDGDVRACAQTGRNAIHYTLRDGRQRFLAFNPQFVRFLRIAHRGDGNLTVHRLWVTQFRFGAEPKGDFACSDDGINRVYQAARWTAALNTLDAYMDCPHRERNAMYGVEGYWMQKAVYPLFGDTSVSRRAIISGADSVDDPAGTAGPPGLVHVAYPMHLKYFNTVIPTQPLFWVLHAGLYERCSGDRELIRVLLPVIRRNLAALDGWRNSDGLLESIPGWMFFDYARIRTDGVSVALNAVYAKTLDEAARLERLAGDAGHAEEWARLAGRVRDSLNRLCPGDNFYPDVLLRKDKQELAPSREACETTQYFVLWSNVPTLERRRRMWRALRDDFLPTPRNKVEPIRGLSRAGLYPFAQRLEVAAELGDHAALLRDTKAMFLPMVESAPGTLWEDPMARIALCHSIGCGVAGILTEEVLGIRLGFPLKITPHRGGALQWCEGHITTPKGRIEVAWDWRTDRYQLRASIPSGITAEAVLPPEAKAVWQLAPSTSPWRESHTVRGDTTILVTPGNVQQQAATQSFSSSNLAGSAQISVSSAQAQYAQTNAIDGDRTTEWASVDELHPWIKLEWKTPVKVGRLVLCDRSDPRQNAQGGKLLFSDGSTLDVDGIPPDGKPCEVRFAPRSVTWLRLDLFSARGKQCGLAEIEVYADGEQMPQPVPTTYPSPGTLVAIAQNDPRITTVDGVREGHWSGAMWCPFAGTSVKLFAVTGPGGGMADVYIDGIYQQTADWYSATDVRDATEFTADKLADGKHLLGILTRGAKHPESKGTPINWSRIEYVAGAQAERFVLAKRTRFDPNVPLWLDDRGEPLQCHMGGIMHHAGKYYLLGTDWRAEHLPGFQNDWVKNAGFAVYSSPDLMNWTYHGNCCGPASAPDHPLYDYTHIVGRVRPLRARGTGKFVALFEVVDDTFHEINVTATAVADHPEGPYTWHGILHCDGRPVQGADTAVFTDDDGTQYLVTGLAGPRDWNVADCLYQLAPDCLSAVKCKRLGTGGEAPALFKHDGVYYLLHSHLTGLGVNDNFYHTATNLWGPWQAKGNIAQGPHSAKTFLTQTMDVVPLAGGNGAFIWIGDSIRNNAPPYARTVWLPVTIQSRGEMEIRWRDSWKSSVFRNVLPTH